MREVWAGKTSTMRIEEELSAEKCGQESIGVLQFNCVGLLSPGGRSYGSSVMLGTSGNLETKVNVIFFIAELRLRSPSVL